MDDNELASRAYPKRNTSLLIQLGGHAGSGKSTLARELAGQLHGIVIDLDSIKTALLDSGAGWDLASAASYAVIYSLVDDNLVRAGAVVIVDVPSYWPEIHERLGSTADRVSAKYVFVECEAPEHIRAARISSRVGRRSQISTLGSSPPDAAPANGSAHLREIQRPLNRLCVHVNTEGTTAAAHVLSHI